MTERKGTYTTRRFDDPLDKLLDRPIAYNPAFKSITGSTVAALFLSQAWYWTKRTSNEDGWFYKTQAEWEEETGLTRSEQETARKHLKESGIMEEDLRGIPAQLFYRLEKDRIYSLLGVQYAETPQTCLPEGVIQASGIVADINKNTENTSENTTPKPQLRGIESAILQGRPVTEDDLMPETKPLIAVRERLCALNHNWPKYGEGKHADFDRVTHQIAKAEAEGHGTVEKFIEWVRAKKDAENTIQWYGRKPENIWQDWGLCFDVSKRGSINRPEIITLRDDE